MTEAAILSQDKLDRLTLSQSKLLNATYKAPDGLTLEIFRLAIQLLKKGKYPWGASKRIYVPKPGTDAKRPITISPFMDKVIQTAIKMVLEAIYEPWFEKTNRSFGFRANKGCQDAIFCLTTPHCQNMKIAIEGDIESAYDKVNREKLIEILKERIADKRFINLMAKRLDCQIFDAEENIFKHEETGIPQGGSDCPYLYNIYMKKLDDAIIKYLDETLGKINTKNKTKWTKYSPDTKPLK